MRSSDNITRRGDLADCRVRIQWREVISQGVDKLEVWRDVGGTDDAPVRWRHAKISTTQRQLDERESSEAVVADNQLALRIDYIRGVDTSCRVLLRGDDEPYAIIRPPEDVNNMKRSLVLHVRKVDMG